MPEILIGLLPKTATCIMPILESKRLEERTKRLGFSDAQIDEGIIAVELPNLSLFLMEKAAFENYSKKAGRGAGFPDDNIGIMISCAMRNQEEVDAILENAPGHGGAVPNKPAMDETSGGYIGYFSDPGGHLWELVFPQPAPGSEHTEMPQ